MTTGGESIAASLAEVARERERRLSLPHVAARVDEVKNYQHRRFEKTYADLLSMPRYRQSTRFFLDELYGPQDFRLRDQQFARIVPALVRLFSSEVVGTVADLAALHALSERLDTEMAIALEDGPPVDGARYAAAWRAVGQPEQRLQQVALMLRVGTALDRYTANAALRRGLHLMRLPAAMAGLGDLQRFLEAGFDAFGSMRGGSWFLEAIAHRERALAASLVTIVPGTLAWERLLGELP